MRARTPSAAVLVLAVAVATGGCASTKKDAPEAGSVPTSPGTASASGSPAVTGTGGRVLVVPADSPGTGRCSPAPRRGVVCSADRRTTYRFQPGAVRTVALATASGEYDARNGWQVVLTATSAGTRTLAAVTATAARTRQLVLLLTPGSRQLIAAPQVQQPITDGQVQIGGDFSEADARRIVRQVTSPGG